MDTYYFTLHTKFTLILYQNREECNQRGGTEDGTCASGFGVCCICKFSMLTAASNLSAVHVIFQMFQLESNIKIVVELWMYSREY